ncbi:MAG: hypothetical protein ACI9OD_000488 [Limisphaerales bacterium]|jgi:hypothetical protein
MAHTTPKLTWRLVLGVSLSYGGLDTYTITDDGADMDLRFYRLPNRVAGSVNSGSHTTRHAGRRSKSARSVDTIDDTCDTTFSISMIRKR